MQKQFPQNDSRPMPGLSTASDLQPVNADRWKVYRQHDVPVMTGKTNQTRIPVS